MSRRAVVLTLVAVLGGCPATKPPASKATPVTAARLPDAVRPACIRPPEVDGVITRATGSGTKVAFCVGATTECFALELGSGKLARLAEPPVAERGGARVEMINPELKVCTGADCKTMTTKILPGMAAMHATTNAAGTVAVVLLGDAAAGKGYAEVWDVTSGKRTATFKYARGDSIYLNASTCGSPAARGALYSLKGKKIANVGGKDFGTFGTAAAPIEGTTWGFLEENGNQVAIQDVAKGKVTKVLDITHLWSPDGQKTKDAMGNPGESALVPLGNGKLAVIAGAPSTGKVAVVDIASGEVTLTSAPLCK
jgi:hypothetical protein